MVAKYKRIKIAAITLSGLDLMNLNSFLISLMRSFIASENKQSILFGRCERLGGEFCILDSACS